MAIIINNIITSVEQPKEAALAKVQKILGVEQSLIKTVNIGRISLDARKRTEIKLVYSIVVELDTNEVEFVENLKDNNVKYLNTKVLEFNVGDKPLENSPVVVGFGPCGMFAALILAKLGYNPVVIERGADVDTRVEKVEKFWSDGILDTASNVQFGEGGAGTFSDGKLTTRVKDKNVPFVLEQLVEHGAPSEILYNAKPHVGTDKLRSVVKSIREEIIALGGKIYFNTIMEDIKIKDGKATEIKFGGEWHNTQGIILAVGHSARDTFELLYNRGVYIESKPFSVGVRVEHLQKEIDKALYGNMAGNPILPKGEYQLSHRMGERCVYTFCMCPGGIVVPAASEDGGVVVNGMSYHARDGQNGNSALAVSVDKKDFGNEWNSGIEFQRDLERKAYNIGGNYKAPIQNAARFLAGNSGAGIRRVTPSYSIGCEEANFRDVFPKQISDMFAIGFNVFDRKLSGFGAGDTILTGVETRTSSPVRIVRNENYQSKNVEGLYPTGEGAGYAGGIISAALDGINAAQAFMDIYKPLK